ncbi:hypothetical protein ACVWZL_003356 [Bradyrhizobium sp. GM2.4]
MNKAAGGGQEFDKPFVLLCEGVGDQRFYLKLFEGRNIGADFSIRVAGGVSNFGSDLANIAVSESFLANVKAVLVVADNDSEPSESFEAVQAEIKKAPDFGVPAAEQTVAKSKNGLPPVVVLMLPIGAPGNLECLCLEAAHAKFGLKAELDAFVAATPAMGWSIGKQSKMRMQAILAASNRKQPDAGFAGHWSTPEKYHIPVDHSCFDDLANFLSNFSALDFT